MKIRSKIQSGVLIEIISALLILLFTYTGLSKMADFANFRTTLWTSPHIRDYAGIVAWAIILSELAISLLLLFPRTKLFGMYCSLILMSIFTLYIGYMLVFESNLPCHCGGVISQMTWPQHFFFNLLFTGLAYWGIRLLKRSGRSKELKGSPKMAVS